MTSTEMNAIFWAKFRTASSGACVAAIKDCHETLRVGEYPYDHPYAQKLWAEIDAARTRIHEINYRSLS